LISNTEQNREELYKAKAEYVNWMAKQDSLLRQKAQVKWYEEGDRNSKYFHSVIKEIRRRFQLVRIKNHRGKWIQGGRKYL